MVEQTRALGILEVRGMAALMGATDAMLKATEVRVCGRHAIGSGWVTVILEGTVAAVDRAMAVGTSTAERYGEIISAEVVPRLEENAVQRMPHAAAAVTDAQVGPGALGLLETQGLAPLMVGADAMVKAAAVEIQGWTYIGGALSHVVVRGDVAAVHSAVEAGRRSAEEVGQVNSHIVIPQPIEGLAALLPPPVAAAPIAVGALGILETTGYVSAIAGSDVMVKTSEVELVRFSIGSGGRVVSLVTGALDDVRAATAAGAEAAAEAGEVNGVEVISRPDEQVMACFGGVETERAQDETLRALGLIETRSTVALVKAVDQMLKAADVEYEGSYKVGYFLTASVFRGDVGAVKVALEVGATTARQYGELVSAHLIPQPYAGLEARLLHQ